MNAERAEQPQPQSNLGAPGAQLKAQREALGWSIEQVADQLKLAPRQVTALEQGDSAALPNPAVVRGFVRAYAKVVKLDPVPLVAMIEINTGPAVEAAPVRREISATFSESKFPSLTQRSSSKAGWVAGAVVIVALGAAFGAYKLGYIPPTLLMHADKETASAASAPSSAPVETTLVKPDQELSPLQSPSVPLISVPAPADGSGAAAAAATTTAPAPAPAGTPPVETAAAPVTAAAATPTPAATPAPASAAGALVLTATQDSWIQIRPSAAGAPAVSRMLKAGSSETFDIAGPALLVVGKPGGVQATLRGAPLPLTTVAGGTTSRLNIK